MKRKGMRQRRKLVLLAVSLIMVGIAVWRIWQTPRPVVLHRQDAWLSSAEPEMVDTLPDNAFTAELPEEIDGRLCTSAIIPRRGITRLCGRAYQRRRRKRT